MDQCEYCKKSTPTLQICTHCEKVAYCSPSHKNAHKFQHKSECYPATVLTEDNCGRFWVASRNISKGELIFCESALVIGPNTECSSSPLFPTCVACSRRTNTKYTCSKCHWWVCNKKCEQVPHHADFECKVFRKNKIHSSTRPQYYLYIQLLRALLLQKVKPQLFNKILELEPHIQNRKNHTSESQITNSFYRFVTEDCNLIYSFDLVDHIVGVNRINSYSADILDGGARKRSSTALFCEMSLLNHDCLPNTRSVIYENPSDCSIHMKLYSSINICKGDCITQQYVPVVRGTQIRRTALKEWFFDCMCTRCSDPTESKTYFSCIKCVQCHVGFMTPLNSLSYETSFLCSKKKCGHSQSFLEVQSLTKLNEEQIREHEGSSVYDLNNLLKNILRENTIHVHHHLAMNLQYDIVQKVVKVLNNEKDFELITQCVDYCRNILEVVNVICPGYSYYRGVILYFLGNLLYSLYEEWDETDSQLKDEKSSLVDLQELRKILQEGIIIMNVEPDGSIYREMAEELESFQRSLESLI